MLDLWIQYNPTDLLYGNWTTLLGFAQLLACIWLVGFLKRNRGKIKSYQGYQRRNQ